MNQFRAIPCAIAPIVLSLAMVSNAHADVYALSQNDISNFTLTAASGAFLANSATFRIDRTADLGSVAGVAGGGVNFNAGSAPFNAVEACQGAACAGLGGIADVGGAAQTAVFAAGNQGSNYARADASIVSSQLNPGQPPTLSGNDTQAVNIAESWLNTNDTGSAQANNSSVTTIGVTVAAGEILNFSFNATPFLRAQVDAGSAFASDASAELTAQIVITDDSNPAATVFSWSPDGVTGAIGGTIGGASTLEAFTLNTLVTRDQNNTGTANAAFNGLTGMFAASTNALAQGTYTVELRMVEAIDTQLTRAVPEPATLTLMGLGLLGLGGMSRRRKMQAAG